jgi:hypothetical protein
VWIRYTAIKADPRNKKKRVPSKLLRFILLSNVEKAATANIIHAGIIYCYF